MFTFISLCVLFTYLDVSDIIRIPIYFFLVTAFPGVATKGQKVSPVGGSIGTGHRSQNSKAPVCSMSQRRAPKDCGSVLAWDFRNVSHFRNGQKLSPSFLTPMGI